MHARIQRLQASLLQPDPHHGRPRGSVSRLDGLEALRGICALIVLSGHAATLTGTASLFIRMHLAVDLFFMLSGYVMARSYEAKLDAGLPTSAFLIARIRRLWPTMALGVMLGATLVASWERPSETLLLLLCNLLFIPATGGVGHVFPLLAVTWSIYFELFANIVHAVILRRLGVPAPGVIVFVSGPTLVLFQRTANRGGMGGDFVLGFPRVIFAYGTGVILWRVLRDRAVLPIWPALVTLPGFMIYSHFHLDGVAVDAIFVFALAPLCMVCGLEAAPFGPTFRALGALSFPLYAVHGPILVFMAVRGFGMLASIAIALVAAVLAMQIIARLSRPAGPRLSHGRLARRA